MHPSTHLRPHLSSLAGSPACCVLLRPASCVLICQLRTQQVQHRPGEFVHPKAMPLSSPCVILNGRYCRRQRHRASTTRPTSNYAMPRCPRPRSTHGVEVSVSFRPRSFFKILLVVSLWLMCSDDLHSRRNNDARASQLSERANLPHVHMQHARTRVGRHTRCSVFLGLHCGGALGRQLYSRCG